MFPQMVLLCAMQVTLLKLSPALDVISWPAMTNAESDPTVADAAQKNFVVIKGGVRVPQRLVWKPGLTLLGAIGQAGGASSFVRPIGSITIFRNGKKISIPMRPLLKQKASDLKLERGDIVEVPNP